MQKGQPIYFEMNGQTVAGIVKAVLPDKSGVIAVVRVKGKNTEITVAEPHKIRDIEKAAAVLESFGINVHVPKATPKAPPKAAEPPKTDAECSAAFTKALAELDAIFSPQGGSPLDMLHLHGMGFKVNDDLLPKADPTTMPIDKMFF